MKIVVATGNPHKVQEIKEIAEIYGYKEFEFLPIPKEYNFDPVENGETFEENSLIKAKEANRLTGEITLADDSGLCTEALNGAPGIHSARYADSPQERIDKLLDALKDAPDRSAKFVCVMTLINKDGTLLFSEKGECFGEIAETQSGCHGFGYDPVFIVKGTNKTMADMDEDEKNRLSHRSKALIKILELLKTNLC